MTISERMENTIPAHPARRSAFVSLAMSVERPPVRQRKPDLIHREEEREGGQGGLRHNARRRAVNSSSRTQRTGNRRPATGNRQSSMRGHRRMGSPPKSPEEFFSGNE